jgi:Tetratricopeptide repeat
MRAVLPLVLVASLLGLVRANEDPDTEVARRHFNAGRAFYDSEQYEKALSEFEAARRVKAHPALDYNIARCLDRLERYQPAIDAYERYIASNPADVEEMRQRVVLLKQRLAEQPVKPPEKPPETPPVHIERETVLVPVDLSEPPPPKKSNRRTVGIALGVIGGALVIGAGIAIGLLVKPTTQAATPDSTGGPHRATP